MARTAAAVGIKARMSAMGGGGPMETAAETIGSAAVHLRAGDGNRTRDIQLGKLTLYQLSYSRRS
jgi:hypothetical protein